MDSLFLQSFARKLRTCYLIETAIDFVLFEMMLDSRSDDLNPTDGFIHAQLFSHLFLLAMFFVFSEKQMRLITISTVTMYVR